MPLRIENIDGSVGNAFPLIFSRDGVHAFCCCGPDIKVLDSKDGTILRVLRGHTDVVTSAFEDAYLLYTSSLDGTARCWDFAKGVCLGRYQPGGRRPSANRTPAACSDGGGHEQVLRVLRVESRGQPGGAHGCALFLLYCNRARRWKISLFDLKWRKTLHEIFESAKGSTCSGVALKCHGGNGVHTISLVALSEKVMRVWGVVIRKKPPGGEYDVRVHFSRVYNHLVHFTTVALHPLDGTVATGDISGNIVLWRGVVASFADRQETGQIRGSWAFRGKPSHRTAQSEGKGAAATTTMTTNLHWHSHQVNCLAFSSRGDMLLSGGNEAVFVAWHLSTGAKTFLPRLGAPIRCIGLCPVNGEKYAISLADNTILVVGALNNMAALWCLRGISLLALGNSDPLPSPMYEMCFEPRCGGVVFKTLTGRSELQVLDVENGTLMETLKVPLECGNPAQRQLVDFVAFSCDGSVMATVHTDEAHARSGIGPVYASTGRVRQYCSLQMWRYSPDKRRYTIVTTMRGLHAAPVSALVHHPCQNMVVSASRDGTFKVWKQAPGLGLPRGIGPWYCRSVGGIEHASVSDASFSGDGSLLAIAYCNATALWDTAQNVVLGTLVNPRQEEEEEEEEDQPIKQIVFVGDSRFVAVRTKTAVCVWNILTMDLWWAYTTPLTIALACPLQLPTHLPFNSQPPLCAAFVLAVENEQHEGLRGSTILFFNVASAIPIHSCSLNHATVRSMLFHGVHALSPRKPSLLVLDERRHLMKIDVTDVYEAATHDCGKMLAGKRRNMSMLRQSNQGNVNIPQHRAVSGMPDKQPLPLFESRPCAGRSIRALSPKLSDCSLSNIYHSVLDQICAFESK